MLGSIIGAVANIAGGILGDKQDDVAQGRQLDLERDNMAQNEKLQREFAQTGVRWRVDDAKAAGIHPALALGAKISDYTPHNVGSTLPGKSSLPQALANAGHDIGRAVDATRTQSEREQARTLGALSVERAGLENDLLRLQVQSANARLQRDQVGPPFPDPAHPGLRMTGSSDYPRLEEKPMQRTPGGEFSAHQEPGAIVETGFSATGDGGYSVLPSKDWKDRGEDQMAPEVFWAMRNNILPTVQSLGGVLRAHAHQAPPRSWLPAGAVGWVYNPIKGAYYPSYPRKGEDLRGKYISIAR